MKCLNCGFECADGGAFCNNCGSKLTAPEQPQQPQYQVPQQPQYQPPQQPQQPQYQVPQQPQQQVPAAEKKKVNLPVLIILLIVGLLIIGGGAYVILDGFDIIDEPDLFSFVDSDDDKDDDDKNDDDKDKDSEDGSTKDADENEEATTAASDAEKPKPVETTVATETTTRYESVTEAIATEAVATDAASRPDSGAYDDYDWEEDVDRYLSLYWEMAEIAYEYIDVPEFEDLPQDVQDRFTEIEDEIEELEYRIDSFMNECDEDTYAEILEMMSDELADLEDAYPEIFA